MLDFTDERQAMLLLTEKYVNELSGVWEESFLPETCRENFRRLIDHVTLFYDEVVQESLSRKAAIEEAIEASKTEAEDLKGLLNTEVRLPQFRTSEISLVAVQSEWEKCVQNLREQLRMRQEQVCKLMLEQKALCLELCEPPIMLLTDPLPTSSEMEYFAKHMQALKEEREQRLKKFHHFTKEIKEFLEILDAELLPDQENALISHDEINLDKETLSQLERLHATYESQVKQLQTNIEYMRKKLQTFWEETQTSPSTIRKFERYSECNRSTYNALSSEMQRCEQIRGQNIKFFVQQLRDKITKMWDKTLKSEKEMARFSEFSSTCYTGELLAEHEVELENLRVLYETHKEIFELFDQRNMLWERMNALEAKANDPSRYNNRGGQLLKEERERKTIDIKLPKVEQQIAELAAKYEEREHKPFMAYGENIIAFMAGQWERKQLEKQSLKAARRSAKPVTPVKRTPLSLRAAPSSTSALQKSPSALTIYKRKAVLKDLHTPTAKRTSLQPFASNNKNATRKAVNKKLNKSDSKLSLKKTKVIATTVLRGRYSGNQKHRRSGSKAPVVPNIVVDLCPSSDGYVTDNDDAGSYQSFQKCVTPAPRAYTRKFQ